MWQTPSILSIQRLNRPLVVAWANSLLLHSLHPNLRLLKPIRSKSKARTTGQCNTSPPWPDNAKYLSKYPCRNKAKKTHNCSINIKRSTPKVCRKFITTRTSKNLALTTKIRPRQSPYSDLNSTATTKSVPTSIMPNRGQKVTRRYHKNKHRRLETHSSVGGVGGERELLVRVVVLVQEICGRTRKKAPRQQPNNINNPRAETIKRKWQKRKPKSKRTNLWPSSRSRSRARDPRRPWLAEGEAETAPAARRGEGNFGLGGDEGPPLFMRRRSCVPVCCWRFLEEKEAARNISLFPRQAASACVVLVRVLFSNDPPPPVLSCLEQKDGAPAFPCVLLVIGCHVYRIPAFFFKKRRT